jgi:protein-S-isoprenylcysteine O-methyltransferase Ste14
MTEKRKSNFLRNHEGRIMNFPARNMDKKKAFTGVVLVCLAVFMMLFEGEGTPFFMKAIRVVVLSVGLGFYVWGRFFSRGGA